MAKRYPLWWVEPDPPAPSDTPATFEMVKLAPDDATANSLADATSITAFTMSPLIPPAPRTPARQTYDSERQRFTSSLGEWHEALVKDFSDLEDAANRSRENLVAFGAFKTKLADMRIRLLTSARAIAGDVVPATAQPIDLSRYSEKTQQAIMEAFSMATAEDLAAGRDTMGMAR